MKLVSFMVALVVLILTSFLILTSCSNTTLDSNFNVPDVSGVYVAESGYYLVYDDDGETLTEFTGDENATIMVAQNDNIVLSFVLFGVLQSDMTVTCDTEYYEDYYGISGCSHSVGTMVFDTDTSFVMVLHIDTVYPELEYALEVDMDVKFVLQQAICDE